MPSMQRLASMPGRWMEGSSAFSTASRSSRFSVVITGAAGILGREFCKGYLDAGANIAAFDLDREALESAAHAFGGEACDRILPVACDITDPASVESAVGQVVTRFGAVDVLHNNAASKSRDLRAFFEPFESYALDTWREVMSVNIDGMFLMAQRVGQEMRRAGGGSVVQTASIYGLVGPNNRIYEGSHYLGGAINTPAVYAASKAAVIGLTRYLATYWGSTGIRVNCLVPGGVESGQNEEFSRRYSEHVPLGRMARASEMVPAAVFLASDASSYVTGQILAVDGGWTAW
jgi:NAD(P)-dependent dehydrogenase (short-subunit alcohol dehydrogenase family)